MPFKSKAQRSFMFANKPDVAKRWATKYGDKVKANKKHNPYKTMRA